ncbi:hypothetical protein D3C73_624580 [compost metagenome]
MASSSVLPAKGIILESGLGMFTVRAICVSSLTIVSGSLLCFHTTSGSIFALYSPVGGSSATSPTLASSAFAASKDIPVTLGTATSSTASLAFTYQTTPPIAISTSSVRLIHSTARPDLRLPGLRGSSSSSRLIRSSPLPARLPSPRCIGLIAGIMRVLSSSSSSWNCVLDSLRRSGSRQVSRSCSISFADWYRSSGFLRMDLKITFSTLCGISGFSSLGSSNSSCKCFRATLIGLSPKKGSTPVSIW